MRDDQYQVSRHGQGLILLLQSFAFKRGVPGDADFVFDTRCLPIRRCLNCKATVGATGIGDYFRGQPQVGSYIDAVIT